MKRTICMLIALVMFSSVSVSAADEFDFLSREYTAYEKTTSLTFELKQPLNFFKLFESNDDFSVFDAQSFFETLSDMQMTAEAKVNISSDYKKVQMSVEGKANIPMQLNKNFRLTADTKMGIWADADFSDDKNPKYTYVMQNPMLNKYMTADIIALMRDTEPDNGEKSINMMKAFMNKDVVRALGETTKSSILKNSKVTKNGKTYTFTFDDNGIKQLCFDIFEKIEPIIESTVEKEEFGKICDDVKQAVKELKIIGKNGVSAKYTIDKNGNVSFAECSAEIDTNIYDFIKALFGFSADISKEDCNINFAVNVKNELKNVNGKVKVTVPKITDENSVNVNEMYKQSLTPEYDVYYGDDMFVVETDMYKEYENGELAFPIRDIARAFDIPDENIGFADGVITIKGKKTDFDTVQITENSNVMTKDGEVFELHTSVIEMNGKAFADTSFVKYLFDADYSYGCCDIETGDITACFVRMSDYDYEEYEYNFDDYDEFYVYANSFIRDENGEILIPVGDMLDAFNIFDDDIVYENGVLTVFAKKPFKKLVAERGSNIVNADGKQYITDTVLIEKDGILYADFSFTEQVFDVELVYGQYDIQNYSIDCMFYKKGKLKTGAYGLPDMFEL